MLLCRLLTYTFIFKHIYNSKVRRTILPKLRKKLKGEITQDGIKKRKRAPRKSPQVFNPILHIKKEKTEDESTMTTSIDLDNDIHDMSTLTDAENCYNLVTKIRKFFKTAETAVLTEDKFNELISSEYIANAMDSASSKLIQETVFKTVILPPMPDLNSTLNEDNGILASADLKTNDKNKDDNNNKMIHTCQGGCKYNMVINENPYKETLDRDYGKNMVCAKKDCGLSLFQCFKTRDKGGCAYICDGCKKHDCKNMYCVRCFMLVDTEEGKSTRQRRSTRKS